MKKVNIYTNGSYQSEETERQLRAKLDAAGFVVTKHFDKNAELLICIGGDGAFLKAVHEYDFPQMSVIGINTGHLGFFQEIDAEYLDDFINKYITGCFSANPLTTVEATVTTKCGTHSHIALNEISIKGCDSYSIHLTMNIGDSFIERYSGDGILVATPSGSTAYNYSLGGSIVDPRLNLLQVTPIAPMNTIAYRSLTSSILLPSDLKLTLYPEMAEEYPVLLVQDGQDFRYEHPQKIVIEYGRKKVNLLRSEHYDFWGKVKSKFL